MEPDNSNQTETGELQQQVLIEAYNASGGGETLEELQEIADKEKISLEEVLTAKLGQAMEDNLIAQVSQALDQTPETTEESESIPSQSNDSNQVQEQSPNKQTAPQRDYSERQAIEQARRMSDPAKTEQNRQEELAKRLKVIEQTQKSELLELEKTLNQLSIDLPENSSPELKEKYDKQFNELFKAHDVLTKKYFQTTEHLSSVEQNLKNINDLITERDKTKTTDPDKSKELAEQAKEFKADEINLKELQTPPLNLESVLNELPKNSNYSGQQVPWSKVVEKRDSLIPPDNNQQTDLKTEETSSLKEGATPTSSPTPLKKSASPTPSPTSQIPPLTPPKSDTIVFDNNIPKSNKSTEQTFKPENLNIQSNIPSNNLLSKAFEFLEPNNKNFEADHKFSYNNEDYTNSNTTKFESPEPFKLNLNAEQTFQPISDLPGSDSVLPTADSEGSEKLDLILGDTGLTNQLLTQLIQALPTMLAGSAMANMAGSQSPSAPQNIPINIPSSASNKSTTTPSIPNIPGIRAGIGIA